MNKSELPEVERPFRINGKDLTFFKLEHDESFENNVRLQLYFRHEDIWHYPPTNQMETRAWNALEKKGFHYADKEYEAEVERHKKMEEGTLIMSREGFKEVEQPKNAEQVAKEVREMDPAEVSELKREMMNDMDAYFANKKSDN